MPPRYIFNPADGQWIQVDDGSPTPPSMDTIGQAVAPTQQNQPPPAPTSLDQFGDFDPTFDAANSNLQFRQNQANTDFTNQTNQLNSYYTPQYARLQQQHADNLDTWKAQAAQQGSLYSSPYLTGIGKEDTSFQDQFGGMQQAQQQQTEGLANQRLSTLNDVAQQLGVAQRAHADFLTQQAEQRAAQQAQTEAAQQALQQQQDQNNSLANSLGISPTGQYIPTSAFADPTPNVNIIPRIGEGDAQQPPEYQRNPDLIGQRMLDDWTQQLGMLDQYPALLGNAQNAFQYAQQNNPDLAGLLGGPSFEAIRRRLGM